MWHVEIPKYISEKKKKKKLTYDGSKQLITFEQISFQFPAAWDNDKQSVEEVETPIVQLLISRDWSDQLPHRYVIFHKFEGSLAFCFLNVFLFPKNVTRSKK